MGKVRQSGCSESSLERIITWSDRRHDISNNMLAVPIGGLMMIILPLYYTQYMLKQAELNPPSTVRIIIIAAIFAFGLSGLALVYASAGSPNRPQVYAPTWEYEWNGEKYTYIAKDYANVNVPQPTEPHFFIQRACPSRSI